MTFGNLEAFITFARLEEGEELTHGVAFFEYFFDELAAFGGEFFERNGGDVDDDGAAAERGVEVHAVGHGVNFTGEQADAFENAGGAGFAFAFISDDSPAATAVFGETLLVELLQIEADGALADVYILRREQLRDARAAERSATAVQGFKNSQFLLFAFVHKKSPVSAKLPINKFNASFLINLLHPISFWDIYPVQFSAGVCRNNGSELPRVRLMNKKESL